MASWLVGVLDALVIDLDNLKMCGWMASWNTCGRLGLDLVGGLLRSVELGD